MIPASDLKVEIVGRRGVGGQQVGYPDSTIRVTHIPTGIVAQVQCRSQHRSRAVAIEMIEAALTSPTFR